MEPSEDGGDAVPVAFREPPQPPEPEAPEPPEPEAPAEDHLVRVAVTGPWGVRAFQASRTLTIDRSGVLVPESDVPALISSAALAGVTLKVG